MASNLGKLTLQWQAQQEEVISGWLTKQTGRYKAWKKRWCSVRGLQMLYFRDMLDAKPLGVITLVYPLDSRGAMTREVVALPKGERKHSIHIKGKKQTQRDYLFCADSDDEMDKWLLVLQGIVYGQRMGGKFGMPLAAVLASEDRGKDALPLVADRCMEYLTASGLKEVGVFRKPGNAKTVHELTQLYQRGIIPQLSSSNVHAVASLLKKYVSLIPDLLPYCFAHYVEIFGRYKQADKDIEILKAMVLDMPRETVVLLRALCLFFNRIAEHSDTNMMNVANLAMVFGPCILTPKTADPMELMKSTGVTKEFLQALITNHEELFAVLPAELTSKGGSEPPVNVPRQYSTGDLLPDLDSDDDDVQNESCGSASDSAAGSLSSSVDTLLDTPLSPTGFDERQGSERSRSSKDSTSPRRKCRDSPRRRRLAEAGRRRDSDAKVPKDETAALRMQILLLEAELNKERAARATLEARFSLALNEEKRQRMQVERRYADLSSRVPPEIAQACADAPASRRGSGFSTVSFGRTSNDFSLDPLQGGNSPNNINPVVASLQSQSSASSSSSPLRRQSITDYSRTHVFSEV